MTSEPRAPQPLTSTSQAPQTSTSTSLDQSFSPQRSPLAPPAMLYNSYPSSTLHTYYPNPTSPQNFVHISTHTSSPPLQFSPILLPSASRSHVPTIRGTPSTTPINQLNVNIDPRTPFVHFTSPLLSPLHFPQPFPQPLHSPILNNQNSHHTSPQSVRSALTPHDSVLFSPLHGPVLPTTNHFSPVRHNPLFLNSPTTTVSQHNAPIAHLPHSSENHRSPVNIQHHLSFENSHSPIASSENHRFATQSKTFLKITLPSTKDIPILSGKHDWGPWHTAVWTLIDCSNLLSHVHENMLPGASYDPDLEPTFPPDITRDSSQHEKDLYSEWWNHDKVASYILT